MSKATTETVTVGASNYQIQILQVPIAVAGIKEIHGWDGCSLDLGSKDAAIAAETIVRSNRPPKFSTKSDTKTPIIMSTTLSNLHHASPTI